MGMGVGLGMPQRKGREKAPGRVLTLACRMNSAARQWIQKPGFCERDGISTIPFSSLSAHHGPGPGSVEGSDGEAGSGAQDSFVLKAEGGGQTVSASDSRVQGSCR